MARKVPVNPQYTDEQILAMYFVDKFELKLTNRMFQIQMSAAGCLLNTGFTLEQITDTIDYLYINRPKGGLNSLGFLQYVINDTLIHIKVLKAQTPSEPPIYQEVACKEIVEDNTDKFNNKPKRGIKGAINVS